jgi:hypothetical protein
MSLIPLSSDGFNAMSLNLRSDEITMLNLLAPHGAWMKPTSKSEDDGLTSIEPSINMDSPLTFC